MIIESILRGEYRLFSINQDLTLYSELSVLKEVIENSLINGEKNIALRFTEGSYFSSQSVSILVACVEMIKDCNGKLAIIKPNHSLLHLLTIINLDGFIQIFDSVKGLVSEKTKATASR